MNLKINSGLFLPPINYVILGLRKVNYAIFCIFKNNHLLIKALNIQGKFLLSKNLTFIFTF